jgi:uncharacterized protein (TIGR01777 family)
MKIVIAGGSGSLGRRLSAHMAGLGHDVVVLTRTPRPSPYRQVAWDGVRVGDWAGELAGSAVVNLAGELVDRRPTPANIELLTRSRVEPTRALAAAVRELGGPVPAWVQASTLAIYGEAGESLLSEDSALGTTPPQMVSVARAWEEAAARAPAERQVVLRTSIVLDRDTPALNRLAGLVRWGLGGRVGSGRQWFSWIHVDDWLRIAECGILGHEAGEADSRPGPATVPHEPLRGVVLTTAPHPVRNSELMHTLRRTLRRPIAPPTPAPLVRLGAVLLRTDPALALTGRRAVSTRLTERGFGFRHPHLGDALADLLS